MWFIYIDYGNALTTLDAYFKDLILPRKSPWKLPSLFNSNLRELRSAGTLRIVMFSSSCRRVVSCDLAENTVAVLLSEVMAPSAMEIMLRNISTVRWRPSMWAAISLSLSSLVLWRVLMRRACSVCMVVRNSRARLCISFWARSDLLWRSLAIWTVHSMAVEKTPSLRLQSARMSRIWSRSRSAANTRVTTRCGGRAWSVWPHSLHIANSQASQNTATTRSSCSGQ